MRKRMLVVGGLAVLMTVALLQQFFAGHSSSLRGEVDTFKTLLHESYNGMCGSFDPCVSECKCYDVIIDIGDGNPFPSTECQVEERSPSFSQLSCGSAISQCGYWMVDGLAENGDAYCQCVWFDDPSLCSGGTSGDTGSTTGGSTGGSTGGDTGSTTGGSTGGDTGSTTGGSTGGSTGGDTGSTTGGSTGGDTGSTTGGDTGSNGDSGDNGDTSNDPDPCADGGDSGDSGGNGDSNPPEECPEGQVPRRQGSICVPTDCQSCFDSIYDECMGQVGSTDTCGQNVLDCCPTQPDPSGLGCLDQGGVWYCDDDPSYVPPGDTGGSDPDPCGDTGSDGGGNSSTPASSAPSSSPPECTSDSDCTPGSTDCVGLCSGGQCFQSCPRIDPPPTNCQNFPCERTYCGADNCGGCCAPGGSSSSPKPPPPSPSSPSSSPSSPSSSPSSKSSTPSSPSSSSVPSGSSSSRPSSTSRSSMPQAGFCCYNGFCSNCDGGPPLNQCMASCGNQCDPVICAKPEEGCRYDTDAEVEDCGCAPIICDECDEDFDISTCPDPQSQLPDGASAYVGEFICNVASIPKCGCPIIECISNVSYCCNLSTGQCDADNEMTSGPYGSCESEAIVVLNILPEDYKDLAEEYEDLGNGFHVNKNAEPQEEGPTAAERCATSCTAVGGEDSGDEGSASSSGDSDSDQSLNSEGSSAFSIAFSETSSDQSANQSSTISISSGGSSNSFSLSFSFSSSSYSSTSSSTKNSVGNPNSNSSTQSQLFSNFSSQISGPTCGDGFVNQSFETCDDGNVLDNDGCSSICKIERNRDSDPRTNVPAVCGDGSLQIGEQCDDRNTSDGDGCSSQCLLEPGTEPRCGDSILTIDEDCDYGVANADRPNFCRTDCSAPECGDSIVDDRMGEECDDGNTRSGDGCSEQCVPDEKVRLVASAAVCGNGILDLGEECDDANARDNDGCSRSCLLEIGICGDGIVQSLLGEQCESSSHDPSLPYTCVRCKFVSESCGDGALDPGEECDKGAANSNAPDADCRADCSIGRCGDGVLDSGEQCDDGNRVGKDGCDRYCNTESSVLAQSQTSAGSQQSSLGIPFPQYGVAGQQYQQFGQYPQYQQYQQQYGQFPYQLPLAQLQPLVQGHAPVGDTGPAAVAAIGAGAAAGFSWMRRKKK